jgi:hypothetical protein
MLGYGSGALELTVRSVYGGRSQDAWCRALITAAMGFAKILREAAGRAGDDCRQVRSRGTEQPISIA